MLVKFITHSSLETKAIGEKLIRLCLEKEAKLSTALVISLEGNLGGGKTTFLQGVAKVLQIEKILSPTFVLFRKYSLIGLPFQAFYHFDWYRLTCPQQVQALGWQEKVANPQNIIAVEWGNKFLSLLPSSTVRVEFRLTKLREREIIINLPTIFS